MAMNNVYLLSNHNGAEEGKEGEHSGKGASAVKNHNWKIVNFESV